MEPKIILSIDESIQRLKAEIIAQDWRLSPNRASQLEAAFDCLQQCFKTRKATHAMLVMAESVLQYIKKKGGNPPETIDFLKEAMAHIVSLYEELAYSPEKEEQIFQNLFNRFNRLKVIIKDNKSGTAPAPLPVKEIQEQPEIDTKPVDNVPPEPSLPPTAAKDNTDVEHLINDLKATLEKAGEVGSAIGRVLAEILDKENIQYTPEAKPATEKSQFSPKPVLPPEGTTTRTHTFTPRVQPCPPTKLKELVVNGKTVALIAEDISLSRPVKATKLPLYLKQSSIPLKDFSSLFQGLSKQFRGTLSQIKDSKLKQLKLPILTPEGSDWPETPEDKATELVVVSNGNWHGIILCSSICTIKDSMTKFEKQKDGDITGVGYLDSGQQVDLLDLQRILHREGFLVMV